MSKQNTISVVVTGVGAVASNGMDSKEYFKNCALGITGICPSRIMEEFHYMTTYVGEVQLEKPLRWEAKFRKIGELACDEMMKDAGVTKEDIEDLGERSVFSMASANVGSLRLEPQLRLKYKIDTEGVSYEMKEYEKNNSILDFNSADGYYHFSERMGIQGTIISSNAACASGTLAIGEAVRLIKAGYADVAVAAGIDILSDISLAGFDCMSNLSKEPCKPFDKNREGITIGEGAAFVMLEREEYAIKRGAKIYGRIVGFSSMNEAYHVTAPNPNGEGAFLCMDNILKKSANIQDKCIYINTHGTGTLANDSMELKAMEQLVQKYSLNHLWFSSTKSMIGHCLGASGSLEFACSIIGLYEGRMPISISVDTPMEFNSDRLTLVTNQEKSRPYDMFLSNSFAFAGNMASIGVEKYE
ncbi:beta-ketoacyl-[acyl-carrier-protein] synthase II [Anaerocolumna cellulosilytica]|uniref:Beta-ketoacyl-[acyl-carrier-protein] synthase II n=1 Tax=Anaerocolumna cellulosilytica TaxID=433286 RepID=A0A6S6R1L4_9FIRM|nr:beta-ketoacyl-[acyl-carrier-protein] synthase family protein [Anaerocolumna cellulosilytica]MBB5197625.1 3-oxoacyl-[acyl-carrier-protein] synthase II [Anaerocolumna cellulosilytica]BCJ93200.1 beta-ketoacyl-[acyl-carrier-protein] synthase II [Anaerocolumna cellulosilytica]